jgi:hypothetical protein
MGLRRRGDSGIAFVRGVLGFFFIIDDLVVRSGGVLALIAVVI